VVTPYPAHAERLHKPKPAPVALLVRLAWLFAAIGAGAMIAAAFGGAP
jgi:hypothetical protein